jgi:hypothetical protein
VVVAETRTIEIKCSCGNVIEKKVPVDKQYAIACARCGRMHKEKKEKGG